MGRDLRRKTVKVVKRYSEALKRQAVSLYNEERPHRSLSLATPQRYHAMALAA